MSVAAVLASVAIPSWSQMARREKEAELIFRGEQYARAIGLFQRRAGPGVLPASLDVLVQQRFLRQKYKDPITNGDFAVVSRLAPAPGAERGNGPPAPEPLQPGPAATPAGAGTGGVMGVASRSTAESLREYKGRKHYNEWEFVYVPQSQAPQGPPPAANPAGGSPALPRQ